MRVSLRVQIPHADVPAWEALGWVVAIPSLPPGIRGNGEQAVLEWTREETPPEPPTDRWNLSVKTRP